MNLNLSKILYDCVKQYWSLDGANLDISMHDVAPMQIIEGLKHLSYHAPVVKTVEDVALLQVGAQSPLAQLHLNVHLHIFLPRSFNIFEIKIQKNLLFKSSRLLNMKSLLRS